VATDGTSVNLILALKNSITTDELKSSQPLILEIVRIFKIGDDVMLELATEVNKMVQRRFISYEVMREYYGRHILEYLERNKRVF